MKRLLGVASGIAWFLITSGFCLYFLLDGKGPESSWCERRCDDPVPPPEWVGTMFQSGILLFLAIFVVLWLDDKYQWNIFNETDELGYGAVIGGASGCLVGILGLVVMFFFLIFSPFFG